jgi:hypothetical protein
VRSHHQLIVQLIADGCCDVIPIKLFMLRLPFGKIVIEDLKDELSGLLV